MGVYVFRSLHGPWIKIGHHLSTPRRPNAYYRVAGRGFQSVIHPPELDGLLYMKDLCLVRWYPSLTRQDETMVHRTFSQGKIGEFHPVSDEMNIVASLDRIAIHCEVSNASRIRAVRWGYRQVRRGIRRRKKARQFRK